MKTVADGNQGFVSLFEPKSTQRLAQRNVTHSTAPHRNIEHDDKTVIPVLLLRHHLLCAMDVGVTGWPFGVTAVLYGFAGKPTNDAGPSIAITIGFD